jgi:hypothetical protein
MDIHSPDMRIVVSLASMLEKPRKSNKEPY